MRKILLAVAVLLCCLNGQAQESNPAKKPIPVSTTEEYNSLKASGQIPVFVPHIKSDKKIQPVIHPQVNKKSGSANCDCMQELDASFEVVPMQFSSPPDYRNDDYYSEEIDLPFTFCLYGDFYTSCYINNNGNVSFGSPYGTFTANPFPDASYVMVAPFWGDVDTRNLESGLVYYKVTDHSLTVIWDHVGYFNQWADLVNTFQLVISDGEDPLIPFGNNVSFCYGDMQWTTGDASGGSGGFGGSAATVGANAGDGTDFIQLGQFDAPGVDYDGPFGSADQVSWLDDQTFIFNTCEGTNNVPPLPSGAAACDTLLVCAGGELELTLNFYAPEQDQTTTVTIDSDLTGLTVISNTSGINAEVVLNIVTSDLDAGVHYITFTATDDGEPAATTIVTLPVIVEIFDLNPPIISGDTTYCEGTNGVTLSVSNGPFDSYDWSTGSDNPSISGATEGTYSVTVQDGICFFGTSIDVTEINIADTIFTPDTLEICAGSNPLILAPEVNYPVTYQWVYLPYDIEPVAVNLGTGFAQEVNNEGIYTVILTDVQCGFPVEKDYVVTEETCEVIIPNIFTPNGDGNNDFMEFQGLGNFPNSLVTVYNRWGNVVFESTNYNNTWSGDDYPEGTYFFILAINKPEGFEYHEGHITILREK